MQLSKTVMPEKKVNFEISLDVLAKLSKEAKRLGVDTETMIQKILAKKV